MKKIEERTLKLPSKISVFEARPAPGRPVKGGIVVIQEIFGVNNHIRNVARHWAELGYVAWAPAFFDHIELGIELTYEESSYPKGRELIGQLKWDTPLKDVELAAQGLRATLTTLTNGQYKIAAIGFCWGGSLAWLSSCRLAPGTVDAAIGYYGRHIWEFRNEKPLVPTILHYGAQDPSIPMSNVEDVKKAQPDLPVYVYDAGHGFNCDERSHYDAKSAQEAEKRTLAFLESLGSQR